MTNLYDEVKALLGDECQCGGDFLKCSTKDGGCCSEKAIGDMIGYCGGDTMRKLWKLQVFYNYVCYCNDSVREHFRDMEVTDD